MPKHSESGRGQFYEAREHRISSQSGKERSKSPIEWMTEGYKKDQIRTMRFDVAAIEDLMKAFETEKLPKLKDLHGKIGAVKLEELKNYGMIIKEVNSYLERYNNNDKFIESRISLENIKKAYQVISRANEDANGFIGIISEIRNNWRICGDKVVSSENKVKDIMRIYNLKIQEVAEIMDYHKEFVQFDEKVQIQQEESAKYSGEEMRNKAAEIRNSIPQQELETVDRWLFKAKY